MKHSELKKAEEIESTITTFKTKLQAVKRIQDAIKGKNEVTIYTYDLQGERTNITLSTESLNSALIQDREKYETLINQKEQEFQNL